MVRDRRAALVTGASRGIGHAIAKRLASDGAAVAVNYNSSPEPAHELVELIRRDGGHAIAIQADVSKSEDCSRLTKRVSSELGPVSILVNNAGFVRDRLLLRMTADDWDCVWDTDFAGAARLSRLALPDMVAQGWGRIVNIASIVGVAGNAGQANYAAAKGALIGLTRDLAQEYGHAGVTVNCVAPGYIDTDATSVMDQQYKDAWLAQIPMRRWGDAGEVASMVAFLAGDEAGYISGQCMIVDGGLLISRR